MVHAAALLRIFDGRVDSLVGHAPLRPRAVPVLQLRVRGSSLLREGPNQGRRLCLLHGEPAEVFGEREGHSELADQSE